MSLEQQQLQTQKLILTPQMQQALKFLLLPMVEVQKLLEEEALSNPLLEVADFPIEHSADNPDFTAFFTRPPSYTETLQEQLGQMRELDDDMLNRCRYLVECLNTSGYLDCPLSELAEETGQSLWDMEQALFVVQTLSPIGTGARSLSECLLLQLAQSRRFNESNIRMIKSGLPLLAKGDEVGLAALLGVSRAEVRRSMSDIRALNPIPSRGFYTEDDASVIFPEATIRVTGKELEVELTDQTLSRVTLNQEYLAMLGNSDYADAQPFLKEKAAAAREIITNLRGRHDTLLRVLLAVTQTQRDYFLSDAPLQPLTMQALADQLGLNVSTVSRAVKEKYIQFGTQVLPLRYFFTTALQTQCGETISAEALQRRIQSFIAAEDPAHPLSDSAIEKALSGMGMTISRRTVAKYRAVLGIPTASQRKKK
jgi:RNA polymerase sigma-54 factor